jgi:hypothetical protein
MVSSNLFASGQPRISMQWRPQELNTIKLKIANNLATVDLKLVAHRVGSIALPAEHSPKLSHSRPAVDR